MSILGQYRLVDDTSLEHLLQLDGAGLIDHIEALTDQEDSLFYSVGLLWDVLHFLLTGVSARQYIEDNQLSQAVVGIHMFECSDFVSCIENSELAHIIKIMQQVDLNSLKMRLDVTTLIAHEIYPENWFGAYNESLWEDLHDKFQGLLCFYQKALALQKHVIIEIY